MEAKQCLEKAVDVMIKLSDMKELGKRQSIKIEISSGQASGHWRYF